MRLSAGWYPWAALLALAAGCAAGSGRILPALPQAAPPAQPPVTGAERFAQAYRWIGEGRHEAALADFRELSRSYPQLADYHLFFIAHLEARRGSLDAAAAAATRLLADYPQSVMAPAASLELGRVLLRQGQQESAAVFLERAAAAPERAVSAAARIALAALDERRGRIAAAHESLMSVRRSARGTPAAREAKSALLALRARHPQLVPRGPELFREAQLLLDERDHAAAHAAVVRLRKTPAAGVDAAQLSRLEAETLLGRGRLDEGLAALWRVVEGYPKSDAAPAALFRLASLLWNRDRDAAALRAFSELCRRYPRSPRAVDAQYAIARIHQAAGREQEAIDAYQQLARAHARHHLAAEARWRIGWIHYRAGRWEPAAMAFAELAETTAGKPRDEAMYWRARSHENAGRRERAGQLYRHIIARRDDPYKAYYAAWAEERLAAMSRDRAVSMPFAFDPEATVAARPRQLPAAPAAVPAFHLDRWRELHAAGLDDLARGELEAIERSATDRATLSFLIDAHLVSNGFTRARALAARIGGNPRRQELLYPLGFWNVVSAASREQGVDPLWVLSIIRQESMFDPQARSPADARGLMQLLPSTAERVAGLIALQYADQIDLAQPEVNVRLGTAYLRVLIERFAGDPLKAVAAYNGGEEAVDRWQRQFGSLEADEFVESITYRETRDYVKRVAGGYRLYRDLYGRTAAARAAEPQA